MDRSAQFPVPPADSDLAAQIFEDPYLFDFLGTDAPRLEAEREGDWKAQPAQG